MSMATETIEKCAKIMAKRDGKTVHESLFRIESTLQDLHGISEKFWKDRTGLSAHYLHVILGQ